MPQTACRTGVTLTYEISGEGDPLLLVLGTSGSIPLWGEMVARLAEHHQVIAFDNRGLGGSERGEGWGRCDGFQRSVVTSLRLPYAIRDMEAPPTIAGLAFSPQLLDHPDCEQVLEPMLPAFPQTDEQMQVTTEQWDADPAHDTLDRLSGITAPTQVIVGEQDLLTQPWQFRAVAEAIPGARFELVTGPGSSHGLHIDRPDHLTQLVTGFLQENLQQR